MSPRKATSHAPETNPAKEAVRWLLRLREGTLGEAERVAFDAWKKEPANEAALARANRLWGAVEEVATQPEILQERERILVRIGPRRSWRTALVAASVALVVAGTLSVTGTVDPLLGGARRALIAVAAPSEGRFATLIGERSTVVLSDSSVLTLNTDSEAMVAFDAQERRITLTRGQALFEVAKNQARPFVVLAGDRRIVATGTAFDVRLDEAAVQVTLVEGHVIVAAADAAVGVPPRPAELNAGERLVAKAGAAVSVSAANVERITSWTEGKLVFLDTRLEDAIAEANRYARTPILLAGASLADLRISGVFRSGQPGEFARAVAQVLPVAIEAEGGGEIRLVARPK